MGYAAVCGEALIDLLEGEAEGHLVYRQAIGGAPLNVSVGIARLGGQVQFVGSLGNDVQAERIARFLADAGVGVDAVRRAPTATTLAVATFDGAEPEFRFYGEPPSYALLAPDQVDPRVVSGASVLYTGSIALLREPFRATARLAWSTPGPLKVFDPNVRPRLLPDRAAVAALRELTDEFVSTADVVKLSAADAEVLYDGASPQATAQRLRSVGAGSVVVTCGSRGALVDAGGETTMVPAPKVDAIDATGAGDSVMGALIRRLLAGGLPADAAGWQANVRFALAVAGLVCERRGGAVAMPTEAELLRRWGPLN